MAALLGLVVEGPVGKRRVFESATIVAVAWRIGVLLGGPQSDPLFGKIRKSLVYVRVLVPAAGWKETGSGVS